MRPPLNPVHVAQCVALGLVVSITMWAALGVGLAGLVHLWSVTHGG